ncbi:MAG: hypothetical protein J6S80_03985 [Alphaproteobacteria bacterium]|nr:hypothetical protein [Alphaproteobacteria bacterium]
MKKWFQFTTSGLRRIIISVEQTNHGVETKRYSSLGEMPDGVRIEYITDSISNEQKPLTIDEIAAIRRELQFIIANGFRTNTR